LYRRLVAKIKNKYLKKERKKEFWVAKITTTTGDALETWYTSSSSSYIIFLLFKIIIRFVETMCETHMNPTYPIVILKIENMGEGPDKKIKKKRKRKKE
jgi:hypothetical protein